MPTSCWIDPVLSEVYDHLTVAHSEYINSVTHIQFAFQSNVVCLYYMAVDYYTVTEQEAGQRIDNFLIK